MNKASYFLRFNENLDLPKPLKMAYVISSYSFEELPKTYLSTKKEIVSLVKKTMTSQKRSIIVGFLILSLGFSLLSPLVGAADSISDQQSNPPGGQSQGPGNPGQGGPPDENQSGGNSQNGSGQGGPGNQTNTSGQKPRYQYQTRKMNIEGEGNCTRIRSQYRQNATEESFEIFFSIDNAPSFELFFLSDQNSGAARHHFSLVVEQLIEYVDANLNGGYDSFDVVVSTVDFSNVSFSNITYENITTSEGNRVTIITTHTLNDLFIISIYIADSNTSYLNATITPQEIKFDFKIHQYPYVNQSSQLALRTYIKTPFSVIAQQNTYANQQRLASQESRLNISSAMNFGFFSWVPEAIVDSIQRPVNVSVVSQTQQTFSSENQSSYTQAEVVFSYARGESILHDPKIGVVSILGPLLPSIIPMEYLSAVYLIACIISAVVFYGIIYFRKKV